MIIDKTQNNHTQKSLLFYIFLWANLGLEFSKFGFTGSKIFFTFHVSNNIKENTVKQKVAVYISMHCVSNINQE